jgi:hypothetical protein
MSPVALLREKFGRSEGSRRIERRVSASIRHN